MAENNKYDFIYENSNTYKIRLLLFVLFIILVCIALSISFGKPIYESAQKTSIFQSLTSLTKFELTELTPTGLFYVGLIGGLFFIFLPLEVMFYGSILKGSNPWLSLFMMVVGFMLAQCVNYFIGAKLNPIFMHLISKKKVYQVRRFINKYGGYGVFLSSISPFPSDLLTFALGITRYNFYRLFTLAFIGTLIKYAVIAAAALFFQ